jgi:hypothetical protein
MKRSLITLALMCCLGVAGPVLAGPMTLTTDGHLYKVWEGEDSLVLSHSAPGMDLEESLIPQSSTADFETVNIVVDENSDTPFIIWTDTAEDISTIQLAALVDGTWFGPVTLAGDDGVAAGSPAIAIDTVTDLVQDEDEEPWELSTTFLHTVWWSYDAAFDLGYGVYAAIQLDHYGFPLVDNVTTTPLHDLLPFGIGCDGSAYSNGLAHPQFFTGGDGLPLLFSTDFGNCVFHILGIQYQVFEETDPYTGLKRRRHISVFRVNSENMNMAIPPGVALTDSNMAVGHDYTVLIYWDVEGGIDWLLSGTEGWTEINHLPVGVDLNHEQAVELLKNLVP